MVLIVAVTNLWCYFLRKVDNYSPSKIQGIMLDLDQSTWLKERQDMAGMRDDGVEVLFQIFHMLSQFVILSDGVLVWYMHTRVSFLRLREFCKC